MLDTLRGFFQRIEKKPPPDPDIIVFGVIATGVSVKTYKKKGAKPINISYITTMGLDVANHQDRQVLRWIDDNYEEVKY